MRPIECASMAELQRRDIDTNGLDRQAAAELRRRALAANLRGSAGRNPAELLRQLETRRNPDYRTPAQRLIALEARQHPTAHGAKPCALLLQLYATRIAGNW
jgi:hypothetical protein